MPLRITSGHSAPSVHQTNHELLRETLGTVLLAAVQAGSGAAEGIGSVPCRAVAALYLVLLSHPIDRRGRCRSCRRCGAVFRRRYRRCRVHSYVDFWLRQPDEGVLLGHLVSELNQQSARQPEPSSPTPAVPPPPTLPGGFPRAGRPGPDHGGAGEPTPERPRSRRDPPDNQPPPLDEIRSHRTVLAGGLGGAGELGDPLRADPEDRGDVAD